MSIDWLIGERVDGIVRVYVHCGLCERRLLLMEDENPRELLDDHHREDHAVAERPVERACG